MVPVLDIQQKFFTDHQVCTIVGPNIGRNATTAIHTFNFHHAATGVHDCDHFEVDSSSCESSIEEIPTFLSSLTDTNNGPKYSTPAFENGGYLNTNRSRGRSTIIGVRFSGQRLRQTPHLVLSAVRSLTTANRCCTNALR